MEPKVRGEKPKHSVAEAIRKFEGDYLLKQRYSYAQKCVVNNILKCRTAQMGGHIRACRQCGKVEIAYNSCKDRQCPTCGAFDKAQWLEAQRRWVLPIDYYHIVFTIDHVFNPLVWENQQVMYDLLMRTAAATIKAFGQKYLGGELGFTMTLHTWGQQMQRHPHAHVMVTGGALVERAGEYRWKRAGQTFLFPATEFSAAFREAFCAGVRKLHQKGKLRLGRNRQLDVEAMLRSGANQKWEVYLQTPRGKPGNLLDYLGRYVYKTAISNHRILSVGKKTVRFAYYDNQDAGKRKELEIEGVEFVRRFLDHVLPKRLQRVRHYGLHHSSQRKKTKHRTGLIGPDLGDPGGGEIEAGHVVAGDLGRSRAVSLSLLWCWSDGDHPRVQRHRSLALEVCTGVGLGIQMGLGNLKAWQNVGPGNGKGVVRLVMEKWDLGGQNQWKNVGNRRVLGNLRTRWLEKGCEKDRYNGKQTP